MQSVLDCTNVLSMVSLKKLKSDVAVMQGSVLARTLISVSKSLLQRVLVLHLSRIKLETSQPTTNMAPHAEDREMADAAGGAEENGSSNGDFIREKQRLSLVWLDSRSYWCMLELTFL